MNNKWWPVSYVLLTLAGLADTSYLAAKHFAGTEVNCSILQGCDKVLASPYAVIGGNIPLALLGAAYYFLLLILVLVYLQNKNKSAALLFFGLSAFGFLFSIWLTYLQFFVIRALCLYCLSSAIFTAILFALGFYALAKLDKSYKLGV